MQFKMANQKNIQRSLINSFRFHIVMYFASDDGHAKAQAEAAKKAEKAEESKEVFDNLVMAGICEPHEWIQDNQTGQTGKEVENGHGCDNCACANGQKKHCIANMVFCFVLFCIFMIVHVLTCKLLDVDFTGSALTIAQLSPLVLSLPILTARMPATTPSSLPAVWMLTSRALTARSPPVLPTLPPRLSLSPRT